MLQISAAQKVTIYRQPRYLANSACTGRDGNDKQRNAAKAGVDTRSRAKKKAPPHTTNNPAAIDRVTRREYRHSLSIKNMDKVKIIVIIYSSLSAIFCS